MTKDEEKVTDLETLFAVRLKEERVKFFRDVLLLLFIVVGFLMGLGVFGGVQYWLCYSKNPDVTVVQCFSRTDNFRGKK